jgi:CheY-like chemotaxis protein
MATEDHADGSVLIVDDDEFIRDSLEAALQLENYPTAQAADGQQALEWLRHHPAPSLILLDLMMPVMNGWQLLDQLRADERLAGVPVVIITAFGRDLGSAAHLPVLRKPMELASLLELVQRHRQARH